MLEPSDVAQELHYSSSYLSNPAYPPLLFKLIGDERAMSIYHDELIEQLDRIPRSLLYDQRAALTTLGREILKRYPQFLGVLVEALTAAGAWNEAEELTKAAYAEIPDTMSAKPHRLHSALWNIACSYKSAVAHRRMDQLPTLANQWKTTLSEINDDRVANEARRDPLYGIRGSH